MAIEVAGDAAEEERRATKSQLSDQAESCSGKEKATPGYRRSRWKLLLDDTGREVLTSETHYDEVSERLQALWKGSYASSSEETALQRGMVLNRGWGDSPESSVEFLGGWEESVGGKHRSASSGPDSGQGLGNTELYGFPGLLFEVLKNGAVSSMTIY